MNDYVIVRVISHKGPAYLVEYIDDAGMLVRVIVPFETIEFIEFENETKTSVSITHLGQGIPYGVPWEFCIDALHVSSDEFANTLRKAGVWTFEDYVNDPTIAQQAIRAVLRPVMQAIKVSLKSKRSEKHE